MLLWTEPDAQLVAKARKGHVEAFNRLISRWEKRLYNYLLRILSNREDSLDVCQEAFLKAYRSLGALEDAAKFPQWLFRIAHNLAFSHLRSQAAAMDRVSCPVEDWEGAAVRSTRALPHGSWRTLLGLEAEFAVAEALKTLTPEQREVIVLKVYQGFQLGEIAEILSCPLSTVKSRLYAGFAQLKEMLTAPPERSAVAERRR